MRLKEFQEGTSLLLKMEPQILILNTNRKSVIQVNQNLNKITYHKFTDDTKSVIRSVSHMSTSTVPWIGFP